MQVLLRVAGFPLTDAQLGRSFAVTSGHQPEAMDWTAFQNIDTLVVLMVGRNLATLMKLLQKAGRLPDTPVCLGQVIEAHKVGHLLMLKQGLHNSRHAEVTCKPVCEGLTVGSDSTV